MSPVRLPPLGLRPRWLAAEMRLTEVLAAIDRYESAGFDVPDEWVIEHDNLVRYLATRAPS